MTDKMVMELRYGQMVQGMKVSIKMEKKMGKEYYIFLINQYILVNLSKMRLMGGVHINGRIKEYISVIGRKIKCTERAKLCGQMEESIQGYEIKLF